MEPRSHHSYWTGTYGRHTRILASFAGPIVQVMDIDRAAICMAVSISMESAGRLMAQHFYEKGYRRVGYVGARGERPKRSVKRSLAFENELRKLRIPLVVSVILEEQSSMPIVALSTKTLMQQDSSIDAVFFANDYLTVGALFHCQSHSIPVPQQITLAGFNGLKMCQSTLPLVTTISTPRY